jgi:hypothetical protein
LLLSFPTCAFDIFSHSHLSSICYFQFAHLPLLLLEFDSPISLSYFSSFPLACHIYLSFFSYIFQLLFASSSVASGTFSIAYYTLNSCFFSFFEIFSCFSVDSHAFSVNSTISQSHFMLLSVASWTSLNCFLLLYKLLSLPLSVIFHSFICFSYLLQSLFESFSVDFHTDFTYFSSIICFCISFSYFTAFVRCFSNLSHLQLHIFQLIIIPLSVAFCISLSSFSHLFQLFFRIFLLLIVPLSVPECNLLNCFTYINQLLWTSHLLLTFLSIILALLSLCSHLLHVFNFFLLPLWGFLSCFF